MPILKYQSPTPIIVTNGGGYNTTDWVNTGESGRAGLGDYWRIYSNNANKTTSIVTGNGFTGNAQRVEAAASAAGDCRVYSPTTILYAGKTYKLSVKYRTNDNLFKFLIGLTYISMSAIPINTGNATYFEYIYTPTSTKYTGIGSDAMTTGEYFEFDEFNVVCISDYHILKHQSPLQVVIPNGGGIGTTDWVDSNSDGLADNWLKHYGSDDPIFSIVTGNGFTGNAQRYEKGTYNYNAIKSSGNVFVANHTYKISLKYRMSITISGSGFRLAIYSNMSQKICNIDDNIIGDAVYIEFTVTPTVSGFIAFYSDHTRMLAGDWFEIDEVNVQEIYNYNVLEHKDITYYTIDATAGFEAGIRFDFTGNITIDWGDGTVESMTSGVEKLHTFVDAGIYVVKVYGDLKNITALIADNCRITKIQNLRTGLLTNFRIHQNLFSGKLDMSFAPVSGTFYVYENLGLTEIKFSTSGNGQLISTFIRDCDITGILDFSTVPIAGSIQGRNNSNMIGIIFASYGNGILTNTVLYGCNITGTFNLSNVTVSGVFEIYNNSNLTAIIWASSGNGVLTNFDANGCDLTGNIDFSSVPIGGNFEMNDNLNRTNIVFASSGNTAINTFFVRNGGLNGAFNLSNLIFANNSRIYLNGHSDLTDVVFPSSGNQTLYQLQLQSGNVGYVNIYDFNLNVNSGYIQIENNSMTAAEVNHMLVNFDTNSSGGYTGRSINISGTNAAPDGSSGGYDGLTAKASLISKGFTVTTN